MAEVTVRYHVPRNQCFAGSRGSQRGKLHLHLSEPLRSGRLHRESGQVLCGRSAWWDRDPEPDEVDWDRCPRCEDLAKRHGITWPDHPAKEKGGGEDG